MKRKQSSRAAMDSIQETAQGMVEAGVISNNVFADLGCRDADTKLQQSRLTWLLYDKVEGWPLSRLMEVTGLKKAHAQAILDCRLSKASVSDLETALRLVEKGEVTQAAPPYIGTTAIGGCSSARLMKPISSCEPAEHP